MGSGAGQLQEAILSWAHPPCEEEHDVLPGASLAVPCCLQGNVGLSGLPEGPDWLRALQGSAGPQVSPCQCSGSACKTLQRQPY